MGTNGLYTDNTTVCDGSRSTVIASKACVFSMSYLRENSFLLAKGADIVAMVQVMNDRGWSANSTTNLPGVLVRTEPGAMIIPTNDITASNQA